MINKKKEKEMQEVLDGERELTMTERVICVHFGLAMTLIGHEKAGFDKRTVSDYYKIFAEYGIDLPAKKLLREIMGLMKMLDKRGLLDYLQVNDIGIPFKH